MASAQTVAIATEQVTAPGPARADDEPGRGAPVRATIVGVRALDLCHARPVRTPC